MALGVEYKGDKTCEMSQVFRFNAMHMNQS